MVLTSNSSKKPVKRILVDYKWFAHYVEVGPLDIFTMALKNALNVTIHHKLYIGVAPIIMNRKEVR